ncbi:hypothetical protein J6T21_02895 [Candidatus Saccharibacteria bacterium]|nr:hypothetical protein [Bacilli bacterium]MBO7560955.1 hypothetical protein [Candidatus Saccharibacteria bacterium]
MDNKEKRMQVFATGLVIGFVSSLAVMGIVLGFLISRIIENNKAIDEALSRIYWQQAKLDSDIEAVKKGVDNGNLYIRDQNGDLSAIMTLIAENLGEDDWDKIIELMHDNKEKGLSRVVPKKTEPKPMNSKDSSSKVPMPTATPPTPSVIPRPN